MGSHVDTPEWQSFERRMRARYLARRRRMRLRWAVVIVAALANGIGIGPPDAARPSRSAPDRVENPNARDISLPGRDATVTDLKVPLAPAIVSEQVTAAVTSVDRADAPAPPVQSAEVSLPATRPETEPRAEPEPPPPTVPPRPELPRPEPIAPLVETLPASRPVAPVGTTATNPAPTVVNVEHDVRKVIDRYRDAYERLDAAAARAVWPVVDEAALTRDFGGLTSQRIVFERCDIWRDTQAAFASCSGKASYVPKVGRAQMDVPRAWHFRLQRRTAGWTIESAEVR
jgi:hypothetical protein